MSRKASAATVRSKDTIDEGLRSYFLGVYSSMGIGLILTAFAAYLGTLGPVLSILFKVTAEGHITGYSMPGYLVLFSPLILVFVFGSAVRKMSPSFARGVFIAFALLNGLSLGPLAFIYTGASLIKTFLIASATFLATGIYGYSTKRDLSKMGSFLYMGLIGLIIASVVNIFMASSTVDWAISLIGVGLFTGLAAYDTQAIRQMYYVATNDNHRKALAINGALSLYLDFLNLFLMLLRFAGDRK